ncbi:MAG: helix-turn-helix transcriptional regulator [Clostridia bacterium]|nr:helix-turn-helix transcriptional regulator [Clostridia bacterium]
MIHIGENIKKLRKEKNITQEALANFIGVSYQSVSKWERYESYPDITLLPALASFFGVTTDELLGINTVDKENRIKAYEEKYKALIAENKYEEAGNLMKEAITEFPENYQFLGNYMQSLVCTYPYRDERNLLVKPEVERVYRVIQSYCTNDRLRVWTKGIMCNFLQELSETENSGVDISEIDPILEEMPVMRNTRDYMAMMLYPHGSEKRNMACAKGLSEMIQLIGEIINRKASKILERDPKVIEGYLDFVNAAMPDGDYGQSSYLVIFNYGYLGVIRHNNGDDEGALECFRKEAELAMKYEAMPDITTHTSYLVEGLEFNKATAFKGGYDNIAYAIKDALESGYPLSDEFRATEEFRKIVESIR